MMASTNWDWAEWDRRCEKGRERVEGAHNAFNESAQKGKHASNAKTLPVLERNLENAEIGVEAATEYRDACQELIDVFQTEHKPKPKPQTQKSAAQTTQPEESKLDPNVKALLASCQALQETAKEHAKTLATHTEQIKELQETVAELQGKKNTPAPKKTTSKGKGKGKVVGQATV